jgi:hypothetical protein
MATIINIGDTFTPIRLSRTAYGHFKSKRSDSFSGASINQIIGAINNPNTADHALKELLNTYLKLDPRKKGDLKKIDAYLRLFKTLFNHHQAAYVVNEKLPELAKEKTKLEKEKISIIYDFITVTNFSYKPCSFITKTPALSDTDQISITSDQSTTAKKQDSSTIYPGMIETIFGPYIETMTWV